MGIKGLGILVADVVPQSIKEVDLKSYFGRRIAIDASMSLYQFLIAIRNSEHVMTNEAGDATSHLVGYFYRTVKLLEFGIKPVYVFDGKAPILKAGELSKRKERRKEAEKQLDAASASDVARLEKRTVRVTRKHNDDVKTLLKLMGLPIIEAPGEAEAQCAQLCKEGLVYGIATEDMDGLTFGTPRLIRNLSVGSAEKAKEYDLSKILDGLQLPMDKFIELCIMLGCDYCGTIRGVGPKTALQLLKTYDNIEAILKDKYDTHKFAEVEVDYLDKKREEAVLAAAAEDQEPVKAEVKAENGVKQEAEVSAADAAEEEAAVKKEPTKAGDTQANGDKSKQNGDESVDGIAEIKQQEEEEEAAANESDYEQPPDESDGGSSNTDGDEDTEEKKKPKTKKKQQADKAAKKKDAVPENWLFRGARQLFVEPNVIKGSITESDLKIKDIDEDGLIKFLCEEHGFDEKRVRGGIERVKAAKGKSQQSRIDSFFKLIPKEPSADKKPGAANGQTKKGQATAKDAKGSKRKADNSKAAIGSASKRGRKPK